MTCNLTQGAQGKIILIIYQFVSTGIIKVRKDIRGKARVRNENMGIVMVLVGLGLKKAAVKRIFLVRN